MSYNAEIVDEVSTWEGIAVEPHRFGGSEFKLGGVEIGHIHGSWLVDIPYTRRLRDALIAAGETEVHHVLPESGWSSFYLRGDGDVAQALRLLRLSYLQKRSRRDRDYRESEAAVELQALNFDETVQAALAGSRS